MTLHGVAPDVEWVQSYLTEDKCYRAFRTSSKQVLWDLIKQWDLDPPLSIAEVNQVAGPNIEIENEASRPHSR